MTHEEALNFRVIFPRANGMNGILRIVLLFIWVRHHTPLIHPWDQLLNTEMLFTMRRSRGYSPSGGSQALVLSRESAFYKHSYKAWWGDFCQDRLVVCDLVDDAGRRLRPQRRSGRRLAREDLATLSCLEPGEITSSDEADAAKQAVVCTVEQGVLEKN